MSKMADIEYDILELDSCGIGAIDIASILDIPITWVYESIIIDEVEVYDPFNTINS